MGRSRRVKKAKSLYSTAPDPIKLTQPTYHSSYLNLSTQSAQLILVHWLQPLINPSISFYLYIHPIHIIPTPYKVITSSIYIMAMDGQATRSITSSQRSGDSPIHQFTHSPIQSINRHSYPFNILPIGSLSITISYAILLPGQLAVD